MRSFKVFITDVARKPPLVMPFIGLAHVLWLFWTVWQNRYTPIWNIEWLQVLWLLAYIFSWVMACDLRKWGAFSYILLTVINAVLYLTVKNINERELYMSNLFLLDGMFSFFLLFYYKQFS